jgi:hypothetical protein
MIAERTEYFLFRTLGNDRDWPLRNSRFLICLELSPAVGTNGHGAANHDSADRTGDHVLFFVFHFRYRRGSHFFGCLLSLELRATLGAAGCIDRGKLPAHRTLRKFDIGPHALFCQRRFALLDRLEFRATIAAYGVSEFALGSAYRTFRNLLVWLFHDFF